jgi:hypothetical protein
MGVFSRDHPRGLMRIQRGGSIIHMKMGGDYIVQKRQGMFAFLSVLILFYSIGSTFMIVYSGMLSDTTTTLTNDSANSVTKQLKKPPFIPLASIIHENNNDRIAVSDGFSACLLVMDDNHFLSEWIAYHYFTTNLRTLIIASDPKSLTSPIEILEEWKDYINIITWTQDSDYMTSLEEFQKVQTDVARYFTHTTPQLIEHRARQRLFYTKCLQTLKTFNASWTLLLDTDEFLRINYQLAQQYNMTISKAESVDKGNTLLVPPITEPRAVSTLITQSTDSSITPKVTSTTDHLPLFILQSSPCVQVPRIRFVSIDDHDEDNARYHNSSNSYVNPNKFLTLRYRHCAHDGDLKYNKISKAILDLSRIDKEEIVLVDSIHLPIRAHCQQRRLHTRRPQSLLVINHYMGSYEQFIYRENDARHGLESSNNNQIRNAEQFQTIQELKHPETNHEIASWIDGFIQEGSSSLSSDKKQNLLQYVGNLDKKSWRTYEGDPMTERCALLFFGLPRAFKTMVLPSIVRNLLIPNARHHCDVYVHFYQQYHEAPGRRNRGGFIDPEEIFLLKEAVHNVSREYGPKRKSRTLNGQLKPIVSFTHDTPEQFLERRKKDLQKFHNATGPNGQPLYFPWAAKTYTPAAIDNIVRQWHSIEYAFKLMEYEARKNGITYARVGMFRSDALYMTAIDIGAIDSTLDDTTNHYFVTAPFARYPVNDRSVYGPYEAVKIWATQRFELLENRAKSQTDPGYTMHSERFVNDSVIPAMQQRGFAHVINPDICFVRTRADESAIVSDCSIGGIARNWANVSELEVVESIVGKKCTPFQMGHKWKFLGCDHNMDYKNEKGVGWL